MYLPVFFAFLLIFFFLSTNVHSFEEKKYIKQTKQHQMDGAHTIIWYFLFCFIYFVAFWIQSKRLMPDHFCVVFLVCLLMIKFSITKWVFFGFFFLIYSLSYKTTFDVSILCLASCSHVHSRTIYTPSTNIISIEVNFQKHNLNVHVVFCPHFIYARLCSIF